MMITENLSKAIDAAGDVLTKTRSGTSDSDINGMTLEYPIPYWALSRLIEASEELRNIRIACELP